MLELNLYSLAALAVLYSLTPDHCKWMWKGFWAVVAMDCAHYYYQKGSMEAVPYTLPFVALTSMIISPNRFWSELAGRAMRRGDGMCGTTLAPFTFLVFCTDPQKCRAILTGEGTYGVYAHPNAKWLFGEKNLIYMPADSHKRFRGLLTPALFSAEALALFAQAQEKVVRRYMEAYADTTIDAQVQFRSMAAASSQESFLGPYLTDELREHLEKDILTFTMGFLCFPVPFAFGLRKAIEAKDRIEHTLREMIPKSREYMMKEGSTPRCMLDYWSAALIQAGKEQGCDPQEVLYCCQDDDMARTVLDFLFAAQDATNSALTSALDVLDAHRPVLQEMRREVDSFGEGASIASHKDQLVYVSKVANQLLHHRPPVPMIPHITTKATTLGGHRIGKGVVAIPSITYSARSSGMSLEFDPSTPDDDHMFVKCVTFGGGQHKCPGRRYAESLLVVFLAVLAQGYDWRRAGSRRPTEDEFIYFPTIFPADTMFAITRREDEI
jgi:cytochrome P450 family 710 subfamily A protein